MLKEEYIKLFIGAIKESDKALVFKIENTECDIDDESIYFEFDYQIDDRISRSEDEVKMSIQKIIGDKYGVSIKRNDSYTNGYASYTITIDS